VEGAPQALAVELSEMREQLSQLRDALDEERVARARAEQDLDAVSRAMHVGVGTYLWFALKHPLTPLHRRDRLRPWRSRYRRSRMSSARWTRSCP
jgi:hypothetical protein